jgi:hypothetical protein
MLIAVFGLLLLLLLHLVLVVKLHHQVFVADRVHNLGLWVAFWFGLNGIGSS